MFFAIPLEGEVMLARWQKAIAILGISFGVAYWGGLYARKWRQPTDQAVVEGLMVPTASLDIGEVWEETDFVWRLPIRNLTSDTIEIRKFGSSCGCTAIEPPKLSIQPGETATVQLTIDLTHRSSAEKGQAQRPFTVSVHPITPRTRRGGLGWQLHGTVRSRVTLDAKSVHFGDQPVHGQPAATRQVLGTVHVPCQDLEVTVNPLVATATVKRRKDDPAQFEISIAVNPELPPGNFQTDAKISLVSAEGKRQLASLLSIAGEMQPEVRLLPARVLLAPAPIGETAEAIVTLQAPPKANVAVDHIEIDDSGLRVEPAAIAGIPAGCAYRFLQKVAKEGDQTNTVRFFFRKPDQKIIALSVEVCYRGESVKKTAAKPAEEKQP
jgi:hypothetical protein